jgi:hypothetical protein
MYPCAAAQSVAARIKIGERDIDLTRRTLAAPSAFQYGGRRLAPAIG